MEVKNVLNIAKYNAFFSCKAWWDIWIVHHRRHVVLNEINIENNPSEKWNMKVECLNLDFAAKGARRLCCSFSNVLAVEYVHVKSTQDLSTVKVS